MFDEDESGLTDREDSRRSTPDSHSVRSAVADGFSLYIHPLTALVCMASGISIVILAYMSYATSHDWTPADGALANLYRDIDTSPHTQQAKTAASAVLDYAVHRSGLFGPHKRPSDDPMVDLTKKLSETGEDAPLIETFFVQAISAPEQRGHKSDGRQGRN